MNGQENERVSLGQPCGPEMVEDSGRVICPSSGYVIEESPISDLPEWRYFSAGGVKGLERASATNDMLRHDYGMGVTSFKASRNRSVLKRLAPLRSKIAKPHPIMKGENAAVEIFTLANEAASHFELPQTARDFLGALLHIYVERAKRPVGREKAQIVAAALEKVVEVYNLGISKGEIKEFFDIDDNDLWEGIRRLSDSGALDLVKRAEADRFRNSTERVLERTLTYITRIVSSLNLPYNLTQQAVEFIRKSLEVPGKTPYGKKPEALAAAAVYLVARLNGFEVSQTDVANVVNLKESTVRKLYRFLMDGMVVVVDV
ncbi:MAG: hypothetical protein ACP5FT_03945 [Acidilobus sp.]